jgi:hypothetical protein
MRRLVMMIFVVVMLMPMPLLAQDGQDGQERRRGEWGPRPGWGDGRFDGRFGGRGPMGQIQLDEDQAEMLEYLREHSPNRLIMVETLMERGRYRTMMRTFERVRMMQRVQETDPELYDFMLKRFEAEDQVLGMLRQRQDGETVDEAKLRDQIAQIVTITMEERRRRVEKLEQQVAAEKKRLEEDQGRMAELVERHLAHVQSEHGLDGPGLGPGELEGPRGPGGPGPRGPGPGPGPGPGIEGRSGRDPVSAAPGP